MSKKSIRVTISADDEKLEEDETEETDSQEGETLWKGPPTVFTC